MTTAAFAAVMQLGLPDTNYKPAAISTRKHEVDAIVDLLESDRFDSATQMARKVISTAFSLMSEREWYAIVTVLDGGPPIHYGMFATEGATLKALKSNSLALLGKSEVVKVNSLSERQAQIDKWEGEVRQECAKCGHIEEAHDWPRAKKPGCIVRSCNCFIYSRPVSVIPRIEAI